MKLNKVKGKNKAPVIMQVLPNLNQQGGVERGTDDISREIGLRGGKSVVVSNGGKLVDRILLFKGEHIQLPVHSKNPFVILSNAKKLAKIIKEYDVDIVHARSRAPAWSCYIACKKTNTKFVTTFHAVYNFKSKLKRFYNSVMSKGDTVIAISKHVRKHILENYKVDKSKVKLVVRGIEMAKFDPAKIDNEKVAKTMDDWNLEEGTPIVFFPGRFSSYKGQMFLIEAAKILKDKGLKNISYLLLGGNKNVNDKYTLSLLEKIEELGLKKYFYMVTETNDMPIAYAMSDIVVSLTNKPEGLGRNVIEASAMGKPVIVTALGGHLETVVDGVTGTFVGIDSPEEIAQAIEKYLKMSVKNKQKLAKESREYIQNNFSTEVMFTKLFSVYNNLLK